ncbi:Ubiquitin-conjugating enzyme e2 [Mycena indigotica]|uniref:E2 ubiquitin-conjugating enzyme n=1 Tax=Mycena indigotica TaxID=2126181 RepID=A0A8H6VX43_9AGAR|nr:Ubiquitin-conjugating enzyme e2 [Mycena indigotica]KAF7297092.1 Ubiquitin-conjugating enzyme e2 [Mycena indigotica]
MAFAPTTMRRLMREITQLKTAPPEGIRVQTSEDNMFDLTGIIEGPESTPYAGGYFRIKFNFTEEFPAAPPKCRFITKIFHPNVSGAGEICVNTLKKDWKPTYGIEHILVTVKCLLIYPNPESALDEEAGKLLLEDYDSYCSRAKLITSVHATPRVRPIEFDTPSSESTTMNSSPSKPLNISTRAKPVSSSGAPPPHALPLKSTPNSSENDGAVSLPASKDKDPRHNSPAPAPLSTADSNVVMAGNGLVPPATAVRGDKNTTTKTVTGKRAATSLVSNGAEKRKKALKRL